MPEFDPTKQKIAVLTVCINVQQGATSRAIETSVANSLEKAGYHVRAVYANHCGLAEDGLPAEDDFA